MKTKQSEPREDMHSDVNCGGRVRFELNSEVRILKLDGSVSAETYLTQQTRSDRKGCIELKEKNSARVIKVHHRRVLPTSLNGKACVIKSEDKYLVICPRCDQISEIGIGDDKFTCPNCTHASPCHWLGDKPMAETAKKAKAKIDKKESQPKAEKAQKAIKEPAKLDLSAIAKMEHCELWTKRNLRFDHPKTDVKAHVLVYTGTNARKFCFNTYNGTLGKKSTELPLDAFVHNRQVKGGKKDTPWFPVDDLNKLRQKLEKDGYERV